MKVKLSDKYQVVIPKGARKKLNLPKGDVYMVITKVTNREITFAKPAEASIMSYAGVAKDAWGPHPTAELRKQRDKEWE
jgi:AbrB family looped-hinge helix DNA binding protein